MGLGSQGGLGGTLVAMEWLGRGLGAGVFEGIETRYTLTCGGCTVAGAGGGGGGGGAGLLTSI